MAGGKRTLRRNRLLRRRKYGKRATPDPLAQRMIVCAVIFLLVLAIKSFGAGPLASVRETLSRYIGSGADYKAAMAVIGRAVSEKESLSEVMESEAIKVFGSGLINPAGAETEKVEEALPQTEQTPQTSQPQEQTVQTSGGVGTVQQDSTSPPQLPSVAEDIDVGDEEKQFLSETGLDSLFPSFYGADSGEKEPMVVSDNIAQIEQTLIREEVIDTTPATEFEIPSPDQVDERVHSLPFKYAAPLKGRITSGFGYRVHPISKETTFHYGVDIAASLGATIKSFAAGTVTETGTGTINGKYIKVDHGNGYWTRYCHLSKISVKKGDKITLGQKLGEAGSTGQSTGVHLHFEVRYHDKLMDPADYLSFS